MRKRSTVPEVLTILCTTVKLKKESAFTASSKQKKTITQP